MGAKIEVVNIEGKSPIDLVPESLVSSEWTELLTAGRKRDKRVRKEKTIESPVEAPPAKRIRISRRSSVNPDDGLEEIIDVSALSPTASTPEEGGLLKSVGIISNDALIKEILDNKTFTHHSMVCTGGDFNCCSKSREISRV
jgi:hypothetical protein